MRTHHQYATPGVYLEKTFDDSRWREFRTGVPVFLGHIGKPLRQRFPVLTAWEQLREYFGPAREGSFIPEAVRGFFENGGEQCYVVPLEDSDADPPRSTFEALETALHATEELNTIDLVCAPDIFDESSRRFAPQDPEEFFALYTQMQQTMVQHCADVGGRFAILDVDRSAGWAAAWKMAGENWSAIDGPDGAVYLPWIKARAAGSHHASASVMVPPCGHIAGVYARSDRQRGVHKAPANEVLQGALDLEYPVNQSMQAFLNPKGINCIRAFPGRGIRVWGARTLASHAMWRYVNVRRVFTTAVRWLQWRMWTVAFEPNDPTLWARFERELGSYFTEEYHRGALKGNSPQEAFYVKCDAETNPPETREAGMVVTQIGLAVTPEPFEFVVVRLTYGSGGVKIHGPVGSWQPSEGE